MKKEIGKYIAFILGIVCIILAITLICIRISSVNAQTSDKNLKEKISEEISYLDSNIIELMNKMNNITVIKYKVYNKKINESEENKSSSESSNKQSQESSQSQSDSSSQNSEDNSSSQDSQSKNQGNNSSENKASSETLSELVPSSILNVNYDEVDWENISFLIEKIYSTWPVINLDLQKQGISNELINTFSLSMDGVIQSLKNKDKKNTLINLFNMYINIPKYSASINDDMEKQNIYNTKLNILNAYILVSTDNNWNNVITSVSTAKNYFSNIIASNNNQKEDLQKKYVILEDLERIAQINDKQIFFMGYKNVMQELENI